MIKVLWKLLRYLTCRMKAFLKSTLFCHLCNVKTSIEMCCLIYESIMYLSYQIDRTFSLVFEDDGEAVHASDVLNCPRAQLELLFGVLRQTPAQVCPSLCDPRAKWPLPLRRNSFYQWAYLTKVLNSSVPCPSRTSDTSLKHITFSLFNSDFDTLQQSELS